MPICDICDEHTPRRFPIYDERRIIVKRVCFKCFIAHHKEQAKKGVDENIHEG